MKHLLTVWHCVMTVAVVWLGLSWIDPFRVSHPTDGPSSPVRHGIELIR